MRGILRASSMDGLKVLNGRRPAALGKIFPMRTIQLEDDELRDAAQAARVAAVQAEKDAEKQSSNSVRAMFDYTARRFQELAIKFERARTGPHPPRNFRS